ncbi:hypothetical protein ACIRJO_02680 [Streptomyces sp. NPDC102394]|uniref:hypothetical protein n=1 Tax=Streptomyces sp. NPDC102394 TaxID=3366167 RepID=UPI0037F9E5B6
MIGYLFLALGGVGTVGVLYYLAPASHGAHRYVVPRATLRADVARKDAQIEDLDSKLVGVCAELEGAYAELRDALVDKEKAEQQVAGLEEQLTSFDALCQENTQLRAALANATAVRQLYPGPSPADTASALPDELQQFATQTATAWRARA